MCLIFVLQGEFSDSGGIPRTERRGGQGVRGGGRSFGISVESAL